MIGTAKIIWLSVLVTVILSARLKSSTPDLTKDTGKTVVQASHFYSDKQLSAVYNINKIKTGVPLIVVLRPKEEGQKMNNVVELKLDGGQSETTCKFENSFDSVCVMEKVTTEDIKMKIKCDHLPCEASWTIYQAKVNTASGMSPLQQLYKIPASSQHMIAIVTCNSAQVTNFTASLQMHSDNAFIRADSNSVSYFLLKKQHEGYLFFKLPKEARSCAQLAVYQVPKNMSPDTNIRDFIVNDEKSILGFERPTKGLSRIDASMHDLLSSKTVSSSLQIEITGEVDGKRQTIQQSTIKPLGFKQAYDFSYALSPIDQKYKNLQFEFKSTDKMLMLNAQLSTSSIIDVEKGQITYFVLKKGQKLQYKLLGDDTEKQEGAKIKMLSSDSSKIKLSETSCSAKSGCSFSAQANEDIDLGSIYFSTDEKQNEQTEQTVSYTIDKTVTKRVKQGDFMYFKKHVQGKKSFQVVVNSPNVIIWAAKASKCQNPSKECYEKVGNNQHAFIYETNETTDVMLAVQGLDTCEFTISILMGQDEYIDIQDSVAFAYEMDDQEDQLVFRFKIEQKHKVSFNLISPLHSLNMYVSNNDKKPSEDETDTMSLDGFLEFEESELQSKSFTILVTKTEQYRGKYLHFSIIASTTGTNLRLQPSASHYQTIAAKGSREFIFQFNPQEDYIVNFYTHNFIRENLNLTLMVSNTDDNWNSDKVITYQIDQASDKLDLKDVSEKLCAKQQETSCQIFLKITNTQDSEIDLTLTLLVSNSIIQLKDGLWQSFSVNKISTSSHFYFFPKHENKSVNVVYKSTYNDLRLSYALWKAEDKTIDPTEWPFPKSIQKFEQKRQSMSLFSYRPTKHVDINSESLKACWPSCVVLVSLLQDQKQFSLPVSDYNSRYSYDMFSILASNNMIEIPQKSKLDIVMQENEEKFLLIDIKYAKQKDALTIFTSTTIGDLQMYGTVYSEKNPRCPTQDDSDFAFGKIETQIQKQTLEKKLKQNQMEDDANIYICILAKSFVESKFYIEWTAEEEMIKVLDLDSFQTVQIEKGQSKVFQITPRLQQYQLKFTRNRGFPFIQVVRCTAKDDYDQCLQKSEHKTDKKQMVTKTELFSEQPCSDCIVFVQISTEETAQLQIHVQSKYSEVELKEKTPISDFIEGQEFNKYLITAVSDEEAVISVSVTQGNVEVTVTDFGKVDIVKANKNTDNVIHIVIPPVEKQKAKTNEQTTTGDPLLDLLLGKTYYGGQNFPTGTMRYFHMTIKSTDKSKGAAYSVSYSSGEREIYLQDGMVTDYKLQPEKETVFFYNNILGKGHAMLSLSMGNSAALYNLKVEMHFYVDPEDLDNPQEFTPDKPPMRKSTISPTIVYSLPDNHPLYSITIKNKQKNDERVTLVINHIEVMLLPFNHQFPFQLHQAETLNFLVDVVNPGYLLIDIKKCDESNPQFGYTLDEQSFQKEQYTYTTRLNDDPMFQYIVKVSQVGTLYMMFRTQGLERSVMSIKVAYSTDKLKGAKAKPGNKGLLEYQLLNSQEAQITFVGGVCSGSQCPTEVTYYTVSSYDMPSLYSQTVCPSSFFATEAYTSIKPLNFTKITSKPDSNNKMVFTYRLLTHISYVGVKGVYSNGDEIYYVPIEIVTLWGQISRTSNSHTFMMSFIGVAVCLACLICYRRCAAKSGYKPLREQ